MTFPPGVALMETFDLVLKIVAFIGIGLFLWSAAESLEKMAAALTRLADKGPEPVGRGLGLTGDTTEEPPLA
jgi:hypothetical protein